MFPNVNKELKKLENYLKNRPDDKLIKGYKDAMKDYEETGNEQCKVAADVIKKEIDRSNETFIGHYKNKYTNTTEPPSWMSLEVSSMGILSKIFQNLKKSPEKLAVTSHFGLKDVSVS